MSEARWTPPKRVARDDIIAMSEEVLAMPAMAMRQSEDIFEIEELGLPWEIGLRVYEPEDPSRIAVGPDGKKIGIFWTHGGSGDFRSIEGQSTLMAEKFGCKVVAFTFPGRFYLLDPSRDWPDNTINPDGTVRTPVWHRDDIITPDQYEVVRDPYLRERYGTRTVAKAKPGTPFSYRMAAWPACMEEGMKASCKRHFPEDDYSIYIHGHSTGGPQMSMLCQRVPNIRGVLAIENSPFGYVGEWQHVWSDEPGRYTSLDQISVVPNPRKDAFDEVYIRTWRDLARYQGVETLGQEGPNALMRLPWIMEDIFETWQRVKARPQFKCEWMITHNIRSSLEEAARVTAKRLGLSDQGAEDLVARFKGYPYELRGPDVKPVPPFLFSIAKDSRDHAADIYAQVVQPMYAKMTPAPKTDVIQYMAGVHVYTKPENDLPMGIAPAAMKVYIEAIQNGYFVVS